MGRERWASRPAFIMAAVGSAIGLGNVWRFPAIAFRNGGGAFFVPYFIALLTAGIPIMIVEYALGSRYQGSAAKAYQRLGKKYEWIGWWAVFVGLVISLYYCVILAWSWTYLWECVKSLFGAELPWPKGGAATYFSDTIQERTDGVTDFGGIVWPTVIGLGLTWLAIYFSIVKGVLRVGKVVMITVPLPLVLLVLLVLRGLTLPHGVTDGLAYYLAPDWSRLWEIDTWIEAYGQIFFSISVGWGILIAYSSYMSKKADVVNNAYMTSFANCGFSFLAGFAVFSTLGFLGYTVGAPIPDLGTSGFDLAFVSYPTAIENFPGGMVLQALLAISLFLMLLTLGVDSAFSIVEALATAMYDKFRMDRATLTRLLCLFGFIMGLLYCFGSGFYWLDITDKFLNDFGLTFVALVQAVLIAWVIPRKKFRELVDDLNARSEFKVGKAWEICLRYITPTVLGYILVAAFVERVQEGYGGYPTWALIIGGAGPAGIVILLAYGVMKMRGKGDD